MTVEQGRQTAIIFFRQPFEPRFFCQHLLNHEGINVHETYLEQMKRKHRDLPIIEPVGRKLSAFTIENEGIGSIPVLHDIETFMDFAAEFLGFSILTFESPY